MMAMFCGATSFNQPLNKWNVLSVLGPQTRGLGMMDMFDQADAMEEKNKPSLENYNKYLQQIKAREGAVVFADEVAASRHNKPPGFRPYPKEIASKIVGYLPLGNEKNADIAADIGYSQSNKREALRPRATAAIPAPPQGTAAIAPPQPPGSSAADALGGRTRRRRRHCKRKSKRKTRNSRKRRVTKRH
jgi:hypothetical protein